MLSLSININHLILHLCDTFRLNKTFFVGGGCHSVPLKTLLGHSFYSSLIVLLYITSIGSQLMSFTNINQSLTGSLFRSHSFPKKEQERSQRLGTIQSCTTPDSGQPIGKWQKHKKTQRTRKPKHSPFPIGVIKDARNRHRSMAKTLNRDSQTLERSVRKKTIA